jgi:hypothetical protein
MRFPSINDVSAELRQINKETLEPDDADEGIDVRLQVLPDSTWQVNWGLSDYDQDHRGYWGSASVPGNNRRFDSKDVARDLIEQAREHKAQGGDDDGVSEARATPRQVAAKRGLRATGIDFNDEEAVLAEMAEALNIDPDELEIEENDGLTGFGAGTVYTVSISGGSKEWSVVEDYDQQHALAIELVKQDLEEDPSMFNKDFIEQHINIDRLKRDLEPDLRNNNEESLRDMRDRDFWREAERYIDVPEEDEDGEMPDPEDYVEEVADKMTEEQLKDPMAYLEDLYGDDAAKQAIEIAGIDVDAAAEDAVDTDGEAHFLARYDSNDYHTKSGLVYWRDN